MHLNLRILNLENFLIMMVLFINLKYLFIHNKTEGLKGLMEQLLVMIVPCLKIAKISRRFWEDSVSTANYIYYNIPRKGNNNKVPFEVLFDKRIN